MTDPSPDPLAGLPLDQQLLINDTCERFEAALRSGAAPRVEDYLGGHSGAARAALLRELLIHAFEDELGRAAAVDVDGAVGRFPDDVPVVLAAADEARRYAAL